MLLCVVEISGFLWERKAAQGELGWTLVASRRMKPESRGDEAHPYFVLEAGAEYVWSGIPVKINSRGFRTAETSVRKAEDRFRILSVGDSVAFGWSVHQDETFASLLQRELQARRATQTIDAVTAAVPGWNPVHARNFLLTEGLEYQPDLVILSLTAVNDILDRSVKTEAKADLFSFLRDYTYGWPFATVQFRFLMARSKGPEAIPVLNPPTHPAAYFPLSEESPVWDELWATIREIRDACQRQGAEFMLVLFPTAFQLHSPGHPDVPQRVLSRLAAADDVEWVDLLPVFKDACEQAGPGACDGYRNLLFADVWMHPNARGHRHAADSILEVLNRSDRWHAGFQSGASSIDFAN